MVISLVVFNKALHRPMYFFLTQLTASDIIVTSDVVPNMLHMILNNGSSMSVPGCITQFFFFGSCEGLECLLLTVMSYDRYLAICNPLRYDSKMTARICQRFIIISWSISLALTFIQTVNLSQLDICGSNVIDHFFCDFGPIVELSCSNSFDSETLEMYLGFPVVVFPFLIIVISYGYILHTILRIQSISGRHKAFSTCSSHLMVVTMFYGTLSGIYLVPIKQKSISVRKFLSLLYTVVTPLINPIIYCLRNQDIKTAVMRNLGLLISKRH
ncbi:olfactory receptor 5P60-like [Engystomops pustulosus]|uniref:olfactory receptor 5P60-like n=1 Tax=Engystomops pustulosus TaxID=76066 RepID=UPI003AFB334B